MTSPTNTTEFDPTPAAQRIVDLDVVRAVALIGVALMNYQGYMLLTRDAPAGKSVVNHVFHPWEGPLSTRFAATFVVVAGMGVTLMTNRALRRGPAAVTHQRWVLVRRGVLLYAFGAMFNWIWDGTILFYYGALFVIAAALFTLHTRWLVVIAVATATIAHLVRWWAINHSARWLLQPGPRSPRGLLLNTVVNGTHPILPWLTFFVIGMIVARWTPWTGRTRYWLGAAGIAAIAVSYGLRALRRGPLLRNDPFSRTANFTVGAAGAAVLAVAVVGAIAQSTRNSAITRGLAAAGRMTLTVYIGHALFYNAVVNVWGWLEPGGLAAASALALGYWTVAIVAAAWWQRRWGIGPAERLYRNFGG